MKIRTLRPGEGRHYELVNVVQLVADAFIDLPETRYLVHDPAKRRDFLFRYTTVGLRVMWERGATVHVIDDPMNRGTLWGAAVWLTLPAEDPTDAEREAMNDAVGDSFERLNTLHHQIHTLNVHTGPHEPHQELAWLAVRPDRQRRGIGSALLAHAHAALDQTGTPARLMCTTPDAVRLYRHHGYTEMMVGTFGDNPTAEGLSPWVSPDRFWLMRRPPNPAPPGSWEEGEQAADYDLVAGRYQRFSTTAEMDAHLDLYRNEVPTDGNQERTP